MSFEIKPIPETLKTPQEQESLPKSGERSKREILAEISGQDAMSSKSTDVKIEELALPEERIKGAKPEILYRISGMGSTPVSEESLSFVAENDPVKVDELDAEKQNKAA